MNIRFHSEGTSFRLNQENKIKKWLCEVVISEKLEVGDINIIFTTPEEILTINRNYLDHDYETDIITFDYSEENIINGDLFVCIDVIKYNAKKYNAKFAKELSRVLVHGILHLVGYKDKLENEIQEMREKEDYYLEQVSVDNEIERI